MSATRKRTSLAAVLVGAVLVLLAWLPEPGRAQEHDAVASPASPSLPCEPVADCLDCHEELREVLERPVPHEPAYDEDCTSCHSPHASRFPKLLRARERALCVACHRETVLSFQTGEVHTPVRRGECTSCHDVHGAEESGLLVAEGNELCLSCHATQATQVEWPAAHEPFVDGDCTDCHDPHVSPNPDQLVAPADALCVVCHDTDEAELTAAHYDLPVGGTSCTRCHDPHAGLERGMLLPVAHEPFSGGDCDMCHAVDSGSPRLLLGTGARLCAVCHDDYPRDEAFVHAPVAEGRCASCHEPHATRVDGLLPATLEQTCRSCHGELATREREAKSTHPTRFEDGASCDACHRPHSAEYDALLPAGGIRTCLVCHETERHGHPLGDDRLDPRTGRPITCVTCHDPHGTAFAYQLIGERTRGLCIECHDSGD